MPKRSRLPPDVLEYFKAQGKRGGEKGGASGGRRAAANMTPAQRKARALKASKASAIARSKKAQQKRVVQKDSQR